MADDSGETGQPHGRHLLTAKYSQLRNSLKSPMSTLMIMPSPTTIHACSCTAQFTCGPCGYSRYACPWRVSAHVLRLRPIEKSGTRCVECSEKCHPSHPHVACAVRTRCVPPM